MPRAILYRVWRARRMWAGAIVGFALLPVLLACGAQAPSSESPVTVQRQPASAPTIQEATPQAVIQVPETPASPTCSNASLTPSETEGPFYKAGSPERTSLLEPEISGTKLVLTGYVFDTDCKPVAGAWLDFWQADAGGNYDMAGYKLRGHQVTDSAGRFQLTTIVPGLYPGRTEHIHVKVQAPNGPVLTTQLYFPGVVNNSRDGIFDPKMLIEIQNSGDGLVGTYSFVVSRQ